MFASTLTATPAQAGASILVEADSGKVLRAENATYPWYPASVTKLMTMYVTLQAVKQGRITLDTLFTVSRNALAQAPTKMGFGVGTQVTADNALKMMMVKSANDMAVLLAEGVDGSIENFADDMTRTAHRLGMTESNFVNPNGLPADGQITSARDLAILARALIHDFPEYNYYWHIPAIKFGRRVVRNYNKLLGRYPGADGMKTGFICASGFNLVATATRGNKQLIAVVLGAPSSAARAVKAAELLESGFTQNPLSWLTPALGQVDKLAPINADPPNLHDEVCGRHRKRPAAEDEEDEAGGESGGVDTPFSALLSSLRAPTPKGAALLSDFGAVTPTVVYTGPTRTPAQLANLSASEAAPHHKKRGSAKTAAVKPTDKKETDKKTAHEKGADEKAKTDKDATDKKAGAHSWTPTSPSALAASPPPGLETKRDANSPKKRHKTKPTIKPTAAQ
ncbi:MAG: D-alanyl-D-alanine carboxypeptidase family protein [Xanthobacteraceae bacterium]